MIVFETLRLLVRHFTTKDYDNFFLLQGNAAVMQYIRPVQSKAESDAFLDKAINADPGSYLGRWAVDEKSTGKFIGSFVIIPIPDDPGKIQLGYAFIPESWSKGYATEVTKEGLAYFRDRTPLTEIYAVTETMNVASQNVLLKTGFERFNTKMEGEKELQIFIVKK